MRPGSAAWRERYGPWALVTGASDGIGREIALRTAEAGLDLLLVARRAERLEAVAQACRDDHGVEARVVVADCARPDEVARVLAASDAVELGLFVACAGFGTSGPFLGSKLEDELEMLDVNCRAVTAMTHRVGQRFARQGRGGIVLMSSLLAFQGVPNAAHYAATKAYIQVLVEGLRRELSPAGVDVLACAPGPIHSGFAARADMKMGLGQGPEAVGRGTLAALGRRTTVRPGWLSKLLETSLTLPRAMRVRILEQVMGGMTRHHGVESPR